MHDSWWNKVQRLRLKHSRRRWRASSRPRLALDLLEPRQLLSATPQLIQLDTEGDSLPADFVQVGDLAFFVAATEAQGRELWKTDGTPAGTTLVRDIAPGSDSSNPESLTELNGQLYFAADDAVHGRELWKSDGTAEGTVLLRDLRPGEGYQFPYGDGPYQSTPRELTNVNGRLFFTAADGNSGTELWMTDGTAEGTVLVKDIAAGVADSYYGSYPNSSSPTHLTNVNGTLFFTADEGVNGQELWKSDGTQAGTVMVRDINSGTGYQYYYGYGPYRSSPQNLTNVNGKLFFTAVTKENGEELWMSDGTTAGTMMVIDLSPGTFDSDYGIYPYSSYPRELTELNGTLFFTAFNTAQGEELWRTDGTEAGTILVKDIQPGISDGIYQGGLITYNGLLFFAADDGDLGTELWSSDGTEAGTVLVSDLEAGTGSSSPESLTVAGGTLYFTADTSVSGRELWKTDGTAAGTVLVDDIRPGTLSSDPHALFDLDDTLLFSADDGAAGYQLWTLQTVQEFGTVTGVKFEDLNTNGVRDEGEPGLAGLTIFVDANNDGQLNTSELSDVTDQEGHYRLDVPVGSVTLRATRTANKIQTFPVIPEYYLLTVAVGQEISDLDFGEATLPPPDTPDLLADSDTGSSNDDDVTARNNDSPESALQFRLTGIANTAQVRLFASGVLVANVTADSSEIIVTTDGVTALPEGEQTISAVQVFQGVESAASSPLILLIDTQAPAAIETVSHLFATVGEPFSYDVDSDDETSADTQYSLSGAPNGVTIDEHGVLSWTPGGDQAVPQNFQVRLTDTAGNTTTQDITMTVLGDIPAYPDNYSVDEDSTLVIDVANGLLANDGDDQTGTLTVELVAGPPNGSLLLNVDGSFSYTPLPQFAGTDSFMYRALDGEDPSNVAMVTMTVNSVNDAPIATGETYVLDEDTPLTIGAANGVLINDLDEEGDALTASLIAGPEHGSLQLNADGSFVYTPAQQFSGEDAFTYEARDAFGASDPVTVTLTVRAVNDPPITLGDSYSVDEDDLLVVDDTSGLADVLANDSDPDSATLTVTLDLSPVHGMVTLQPDGTFVYQPDDDFFGSDSFTYIASDGALQSPPTTVNIAVNAVADPPQANDNSFQIESDAQEHSFDVLANDSTDPDGQQALTLTAVTQGTAGGTVEIHNGALHYTAPVDFVGSDTFTYTVQDIDGLTDTATVTVQVIDASANTLSGHVYVDVNGDRARGADDPGVPGVLITLTGLTTSGNSITRTAITNTDGQYRFDDLPSGTYRVAENQPHALTHASESTPITDANVSSNQIADITLSGGQSVDDNNFGESQLKAEYLSITWFFASSSSQSDVFRGTVALGEERAGNATLAAAIRVGDSTLDPDSSGGSVEPPDETPVSGAATLAASRDTTLYESQDGSLGNGSGEYLFAGLTDQDEGAIRRGLVQFDLASAGIPSDATITDAALTLNASKITPFITRIEQATVSLHRATAAWGEGDSDATGQEGGGADSEADDATWLHAFYDTQTWANEGGDYLATASAAVEIDAVGFYEWSSAGMVADVQAWLDDPATNHGWFLIGNEAEVSAVRFDSRENASSANRPLLRIDYTTTDGAEGEADLDALAAATSPLTVSNEPLVDLALQQEDNWLA